jgi:predicted nucleic acid-binding Zn ribbon protein
MLNPRVRMRRGKAVSIGDLLDRLLGQKSWQRGVQAARIRILWNEIVGPEIAARAQPQKLERGRLIVHCDHDVWRTELMYLKPELLKRIAEVMGDGVVKEIFLK